MLDPRDTGVKGGAEDEVDEVDAFASGEIGDGRPEEATSEIAEGEKADVAGGGGGGDIEHVLDHGGSLAENADSGGDIHTEDRPEEPKLGGFPGDIDGDVSGGDEFFGAEGGDPALGMPVDRGDADQPGAEGHGGGVEGGHGEEGFGGALSWVGAGGFEIGHEFLGEGASDESASTETHDGHSCGHAGTIGEPTHEGGDGGDVAEAQSDAADQAVADVEEPELVGADSESGEDEA